MHTYLAHFGHVNQAVGTERIQRVGPEIAEAVLEYCVVELVFRIEVSDSAAVNFSTDEQKGNVEDVLCWGRRLMTSFRLVDWTEGNCSHKYEIPDHVLNLLRNRRKGTALNG